MSDETPEEVRPEVVEAIIDLHIDMDVSALSRIDGMTQAERAAGDDAALQILLDRRGDDDRRLRVWNVLIDGGWRVGQGWEEAWARQDDEHRRELTDLYDALPEPLLPIVQAWRTERGL